MALRGLLCNSCCSAPASSMPRRDHDPRFHAPLMAVLSLSARSLVASAPLPDATAEHHRLATDGLFAGPERANSDGELERPAMEMAASGAGEIGGYGGVHSSSGSGGSRGSGMTLMVTDVTPPSQGTTFCNGKAMSMYMSGFESILLDPRRSQRSCPAFLSSAWVLDTPAKFAAGCLCAMLLGVAAEPLARLQQAPSVQKGSIPVRLLVFAMGICLGYLLMMLVMTYSVELGASVIAGLVAGRGVYWGLGGGSDRPLDGADTGVETLCCSSSLGS